MQPSLTWWFPRFSYAGLHCVVIKGYSKSAGYQPGVRFEDNRFRNSWNAVFVAGAWRFVQCNWGARHLVNAKDAPKPGNRGKSDSLRYVRNCTSCKTCGFIVSRTGARDRIHHLSLPSPYMTQCDKNKLWKKLQFLFKIWYTAGIVSNSLLNT